MEVEVFGYYCSKSWTAVVEEVPAVGTLTVDRLLGVGASLHACEVERSEWSVVAEVAEEGQGAGLH